MLRPLTGARTVPERGMMPGWGWGGEGVLARRALAQPAGRGPGPEEGTLAPSALLPAVGVGSCTRLWGLLQVAHSGPDAHLPVPPGACRASPLPPRHQESGAARDRVGACGEEVSRSCRQRRGAGEDGRTFGTSASSLGLGRETLLRTPRG